jgi:hypothetical protein
LKTGDAFATVWRSISANLEYQAYMTHIPVHPTAVASGTSLPVAGIGKVGAGTALFSQTASRSRRSRLKPRRTTSTGVKTFAGSSLALQTAVLSNGQGFESAVRAAFESLGCGVTDGPPNRTDFIVRCGDHVALVLVLVDASASPADFRKG